MRTRTGSIELEAGDAYPILIYFGENGGGDVIEVKFKVPGSSNFTFNGEGIFLNQARWVNKPYWAVMATIRSMLVTFPE